MEKGTKVKFKKGTPIPNRQFGELIISEMETGIVEKWNDEMIETAWIRFTSSNKLLLCTKKDLERVWNNKTTL